MKHVPNKSTLSYANAHRPWQMYQDLFYDTLDWCRSDAPGKHKFRFKNKLLSLDSTTISLCLSLFPWAKFRRTKGAIKLHLLLDHDGYLPTYAYISNGKKSDIAVARNISLSGVESPMVHVCDPNLTGVQAPISRPFSGSQTYQPFPSRA